MKYFKINFILLFCLFFCQISYSQENEHHGHNHSRNEIGFSGGVVYAFGHNEGGGAAHLHYFRTLGLHSKWSLGGGIEQAWVNGSHFNVGAGVKYHILNKLSISALPGGSFVLHNKTNTPVDKHSKVLFALHFELVYDIFYWNKFHLGTVLDYSWSYRDSHTMLGIHAAFEF